MLILEFKRLLGLPLLSKLSDFRSQGFQLRHEILEFRLHVGGDGGGCCGDGDFGRILLLPEPIDDLTRFLFGFGSFFSEFLGELARILGQPIPGVSRSLGVLDRFGELGGATDRDTEAFLEQL
jgi:hypothetical protein